MHNDWKGELALAQIDPERLADDLFFADQVEHVVLYLKGDAEFFSIEP